MKKEGKKLIQVDQRILNCHLINAKIPVHSESDIKLKNDSGIVAKSTIVEPEYQNPSLSLQPISCFV